jgi:TniQ
MMRPLPVTLPPVAGELLSSWIGRHAAFYAVPPLVMLRHCLPDGSSLRTADLHLSSHQEIRLAKMFATKPAVVRRMTFANVAQSSHRLLAARPVQYCTNCSPRHTEPAPILRSQLLGWRITCPLCGDPLQNSSGHKLPPAFRLYRDAARRGEKLLDDEAERGVVARISGWCRGIGWDKRANPVLPRIPPCHSRPTLRVATTSRSRSAR